MTQGGAQGADERANESNAAAAGHTGAGAGTHISNKSSTEAPPRSTMGTGGRRRIMRMSNTCSIWSEVNLERGRARVRYVQVACAEPGTSQIHNGVGQGRTFHRARAPAAWRRHS